MGGGGACIKCAAMYGIVAGGLIAGGLVSGVANAEEEADEPLMADDDLHLTQEGACSMQ